LAVSIASGLVRSHRVGRCNYYIPKSRSKKGIEAYETNKRQLWSCACSAGGAGVGRYCEIVGLPVGRDGLTALRERLNAMRSMMAMRMFGRR
jgi:hypothetical protein